MTAEMSYPGFFYVDEIGVIREKYLQAKYTNRFTANNVIGKLFPELTTEVSRNVQAPPSSADLVTIGPHRGLRQPRNPCRAA